MDPTDLLQSGVNWLADAREKSFSRLVTYRRGAESVTLLATPGNEASPLDSGLDAIENMVDRDYMIRTSSLVLGGVQTFPQRGDEIVENGDVYQVFAPTGKNAARESCQYEATLRIHTKRL